MKTNKQIIIEEIYRLIVSYDMAEKDDALDCAKEFATNLLSKLQTLDRDEVNSVLVKLVNNWKSISGNSVEDGRKRYAKKKKAIDQICQLIPEEGVVVLEGAITLGGDNGLTKYAGKKGKLIFIEDNK